MSHIVANQRKLSRANGKADQASKGKPAGRAKVVSDKLLSIVKPELDAFRRRLWAAITQAKVRAPEIEALPDWLGAILIKETNLDTSKEWRDALKRLIAEARDFEERAKPIMLSIPDSKDGEPDEAATMLDAAPEWVWEMYSSLTGQQQKASGKTGKAVSHV